MMNGAQHLIDTPLGWFRLTGTQTHIRGAHWIAEEEAIVGTNGLDISWRRIAEEQVHAYFSGRRSTFELPLEAIGSDFQIKVWEAIREIPKGQTESYSNLAESLGDNNLSRAVGSATGDNPLLLLIPCHRLIGKDGSLTGYAGGLEKKEWLLEHEGAMHPPQLKLF